MHVSEGFAVLECAVIFDIETITARVRSALRIVRDEKIVKDTYMLDGKVRLRSHFATPRVCHIGVFRVRRERDT